MVSSEKKINNLLFETYKAYLSGLPIKDKLEELIKLSGDMLDEKD